VLAFDQLLKNSSVLLGNRGFTLWATQSVNQTVFRSSYFRPARSELVYLTPISTAVFSRRFGAQTRTSLKI